jgi:hypothetical protein
MNDTANGKLSLVTAGGIGIVGVLIGGASMLFLGRGPSQVQRFAAAAPIPIHAVVTLYDNNKCVQKVANIRYAYPLLLPPHPMSPGNTIDWQGLDARSGSAGGALPIDVEFPPPGPGVQEPFTSSSFKSPSGTSNPTPSSGLPVGSPSDYDYMSVTVGGVKCTNWDPGIHVDQ